MKRISPSEVRIALTVIVAFAALTWVGCPLLYDTLAVLAEVPWPIGLPSLHGTACTAGLAVAAMSAPGVYQRLLAREARDREMFLRSLTITGELPGRLMADKRGNLNTR
jgi:hypothetical protein